MIKKLILAFISCYSFSYSQNGPVAAGTSTIGAGGSVSYSIGQIDYMAASGSGGNTNEGLQQPYELFVVSTAVNEKDNNFSLAVFPNPATHVVSIEMKNVNAGVYSYQLQDANGKIITENNLKEQTTTINLIPLNSGIYFINIYSGSTRLNTYKLIKH